ncbi:MAG: cache domain-containing protein [Anaerolineales bacterium]
MSLRWKILLPIVVLGVVVTLGTWLAVGRFAFGSGQDRALRLLADASQQASDSLVRSEDELLSVQRLVVNTEGVADAIAASNSESLRATVLPLTIFTGTDLVAVLDPQGTSLLVVRRPMDAPPSEYETLRGESYFAEWSFVQTILSGSEDPELGEKQAGLESILLGETEQSVFWVGGPVRDPRGRVIGAVLAGAYLDHLAEETSEQAGSNVSFYERETGRLLATTLESADPDVVQLDATAIGSMGNPTATVPVRDLTIAGNEYRESLVPFTARQGTVTLGATGVALLAADPGGTDWLAAAGFLAPYVVAGWLIAGLAGWLVASRITGRLNRLAESPFLVEEDGGDEIALLSRSWTHRMNSTGTGNHSARVRSESADESLRTQPAIRMGGRGEVFHGPVTVLSIHIHLPGDAVGDGDNGLLVEAVRDLVRTLPDIVERHRGVPVALDEIGLVALFGLPPRATPLPVSVLLAGHAALAIAEHVARLTVGAGGAGQLITTAGLHTGEIDAYPVGGMDHRTWVGIGATLDAARELDALGKKAGQPSVAMSGTAYDALGAARRQFEFGRYGQVRLVSGGADLMVYEVTRRKSTLVRHRTPET